MQEHRGSAKALWKCVINIYPVAIFISNPRPVQAPFLMERGISESTLSMICDACFWMATDDDALLDTSNRLEAILRSGLKWAVLSYHTPSSESTRLHALTTKSEERPPVAVHLIPTTYSTKECYEKGRDLDPGSSVAWCNLGVVVGVVVNGQPYSAKECYEKGREHDPVYSGVWFSLGSIDGGLVNGQPYSAKECYGKGLEHDPEYSGAWFSLGSIDGGLVK